MLGREAVAKPKLLYPLPEAPFRHHSGGVALAGRVSVNAWRAVQSQRAASREMGVSGEFRVCETLDSLGLSLSLGLFTVSFDSWS